MDHTTRNGVKCQWEGKEDPKDSTSSSGKFVGPKANEKSLTFNHLCGDGKGDMISEDQNVPKPGGQ